MFTGIIQNTGKVLKKTDQTVTISAPELTPKLKKGDSIAVDGTCLTVVELKEGSFSADYMPETAKKTILGSNEEGDAVNLELPMSAEGRFDGHMVSGHIDTTGEVASIKEQGNAFLLTIKASSDYDRYLIPKGSVTINGISLTVVEVADGEFQVSIIPHTWDHTNLKHLAQGDPVNLEVDMMAKYIEKLLDVRT